MSSKLLLGTQLCIKVNSYAKLHTLYICEVKVGLVDIHCSRSDDTSSGVGECVLDLDQSRNPQNKRISSTHTILATTAYSVQERGDDGKDHLNAQTYSILK